MECKPPCQRQPLPFKEVHQVIVSDMEAISIPRKVRLVPPQVFPLSRGVMPEPPPLWWVQRWHRSNKTGYRNKIMITEVQWKKHIKGIRQRVRDQPLKKCLYVL